MSADPEQLRMAWRRFPTGVTVVTTRAEDGEPYATTANAVLSVSLDPPVLAVSFATSGHTCANLRREGRFAVNFLRADQADRADFYARASTEERSRLPEGSDLGDGAAARFGDALAVMTCRIDQAVEAGDHTLFIAEVEEVAINAEGDALVYYDRRFTRAE